MYAEGLLRKGVGLCHGVGGSIFALLAAADMLDGADAQYLRHAAHLATLGADWQHLTQTGEMAMPDHRWSLYEGLAGMCCAWAAVARRLEGRLGGETGMAGYGDLGK